MTTLEHLSAEGEKLAAEPCHPESAEAGGRYALLMMLAAFGYVIADVAADGLTVEYAKAEPLAIRGKTQTTAYFVRTIGKASVTTFIGVCMNSKLYNGTFSWGLQFPAVCGCLSIPASMMVPISLVYVHEPTDKIAKTMREYISSCWQLLCGRAFFTIIMYQVCSTVVGGITTTAGGLVKEQWAGVQNFQNQVFSLVGDIVFASGLALVQKKLLNVSWRLIIIITIIALNVFDCTLSTLTIFDIVRNQ